MTQMKTGNDAKTKQINYCTWIQSSPETVYDLFATADGLDKWSCTGSVVDLQNNHIEALSLAKFYLEYGVVAKPPWPWKECEPKA